MTFWSNLLFRQALKELSDKQIDAVLQRLLNFRSKRLHLLTRDLKTGEKKIIIVEDWWRE